MGDTEQTEQASPKVPSRTRVRSQIEFPYTDLERALELAKKLHAEGGQAKIEQTQLAVAMDQSASGGTFRGRLGAAKMFGLINTEMGKVWLEPLGLRAIDEATEAAAKAQAFLNIPLYKAMFGRYAGYPLPPVAAIERQMESLGVPTKQKERARQAFAASAVTANYIAQNGRFSKPSLVAAAPSPPDQRPDADMGKGGGGGGGGYDDPPNDEISDKALEYKLVDLMKDDGVGDDERAAIWTLIQYLTAKSKKKAVVP